jgi:phosphoglycolate phosphatase-like HAD superfamily hydrolase
LGDTPHDIACARAIGARTVAVATGIFSEAVLRETAHADDLVVADAKDHPVLLKAMLGSTD